MQTALPRGDDSSFYPVWLPAMWTWYSTVWGTRFQVPWPVLTVRMLHLFFRHIRWSQEAERRKGTEIYSYDWATCMVWGSIRTILAKSSKQETKKDKTFIIPLAWPDRWVAGQDLSPWLLKYKWGAFMSYMEISSELRQEVLLWRTNLYITYWFSSVSPGLKDSSPFLALRTWSLEQAEEDSWLQLLAPIG